MFKKALKIIAPFVGGSIIGLIIVFLVLGVQAAINAIIYMLSGTCLALIASLYFVTKEYDDKNK